MSSALYQEVILDHNRRPRNFGELAGANRRAEGHNALCGDQLSVWLRLEGDVVADVGFVGTGCAISRASASMMTTAVKGRTREEVDALFEDFHAMVTGAETPHRDMGPMMAFSGVSRFPMRVKCASLPWHTMRAALHGEATVVSTEGGAPESGA